MKYIAYTAPGKTTRVIYATDALSIEDTASLLKLEEGTWQEISEAVAKELRKVDIVTNRKTEILRLLDEIDAQSIRALRALMMNEGTEEDQQILGTRQRQAAELRRELAELQGE